MDPPQQHPPDSMSYHQARLRPGQPAQTLREPGFFHASEGPYGDQTLHPALWETYGPEEAQFFSSPMQQYHRRTQTPFRTATAPASSIQFPKPELPPTASAPHMSYPPPNMSLGASGPRVSYPPSHMSFGTFAPHAPYPSPAPDMFAAPSLHTMPFPQPDMSFTLTAPSDNLARDLAHHQLRPGTWPMPFLPYPNNGATTTAPPNPMYSGAARYANDSGTYRFMPNASLRLII